MGSPVGDMGIPVDASEESFLWGTSSSAKKSG
jgi:hypothetical protein